MEQSFDNYEATIDKIIKIHKNSLQEILSCIRSLNLFEDEVLLRLISYLKMYKLYEITCEDKKYKDFKYYLLNLGESNFIFYQDKHCNCNLELSKKIRYKNICIHFLIYKILLNTEIFIKLQIGNTQMLELIKIAEDFNN